MCFDKIHGGKRGRRAHAANEKKNSHPKTKYKQIRSNHTDEKEIKKEKTKAKFEI